MDFSHSRMCAHPHYPRPTQLSNPGYATDGQLPAVSINTAEVPESEEMIGRCYFSCVQKEQTVISKSVQRFNLLFDWCT